jgi:hypothetical protein
MNTSTKVSGWPVLVLAGMLALCVAGCSSDDSGGSQGTFNDGAVEALDFEVGGKTGKTGPDGSFPYGSSSEQITFSVGDIVLGSGTVKSFMTPVDLVPGAVDETNDTVTNIARFLQTLDADADLSNGIQIPEGAAEAAAGLSVNFAQTPEAFENDPDVQAVLAALTTNPLVSAADAQAELQNTILVQLAGNYGGSFTGAASGCWSFQVDASGAVTGTFDIESSEFTGEVMVPLMGSIPSSGSFTLTGSMPPFMLTIVGTVTTDGEATGTWTLTNNGAPVGNGTFTGGKDQPCEGGGGGGPVDSNCPNEAVRFVFTPFDQLDPENPQDITVDTCAVFECQTPAGDACALQVFDIDGDDRFLQFSTTTEPFMVNFDFCGGFDFVIDEPGASRPGEGRGFSSTFGQLSGRQFGEQISMPFATGEYAYRDDQLSGGGGESLGSFQFFEPGFMGFEIPVRPCPE